VDSTSNATVELPGETSGELPGAGSDGVVFDGIVFDTESGISETEQREILEGIEQAVRREQHSLGESPWTGAKKRGILFPLLVNVAGLVLLGLGLAFFLVFRDSAEIRVQGSTALYNSAERALIREIRRETSLELDAKEREIDSILAKLTGVDGELRELYSSNQELTEEQKITEANLQRLQEEYRGNLSSLQDERSLILESSRAREASLRAQFDERAGELAAQAERSEEALARARSELERLSTDQEKGASVEAHLSAMYLSAAATINAGRLGEAAATLNAMRDFINTPSFRSIRSVQPRRNFYLSSVTTLEELIGLAEKLNTAVESAGTPTYERAIAQLEERNAVLEEQVESLNQAVSASDAEGSGLGRQLSELQRRIGDLQTRSAEQERTLADQRGTLEEQRGTLQEQERSLEAQRRTNADLNRQLGELTTRNNDLSRQLAELTTRGEGLTRQLADQTSRGDELGRQLTDQTTRNNELTQTVANLNRTLTERDGELLALSARNAEQAIQIQNLNTQLTTIRQVLQGEQ
jgi:chromosome segregation ATPase